MPFTIPLRSDLPHFDISVELEGFNYTLEFYWNTREACFYMNIFDNNQEPVLLSVKAVIDQPLGFRYKLPKMPPGCLIMTDTSGARLDPTWSNDLQRSDLGDRVILDYFESAELPVRG